MRARLVKCFDALRTSYWFLPSIMAITSIVLAFVMVAVDHAYVDRSLDALDWIAAEDIEGARSVLSTIAGSMISVASLVFSITIVTLTLASSQFGPRLLYTFMRDRSNQVVLGVFISTFLYCLLVLTMTQQGTDDSFIPKFSILIALVLAIASIGVLIFFIHHIAESIQAPHVAASVSEDLNRAIEAFFPPRAEGSECETEDEESLVPDGSEEMVSSSCEGFLQTVDFEGLLQHAVDYDVVIRMRCRPGVFMFEGIPLVSVVLQRHPGLPGELVEAIRCAFLFGRRRTAVQDIEFALHQLVEVAVRALSPGINDPFTAMTCVDRIAAALSEIARRGDLPRIRRDTNGVPRLLLDNTDFEGLVKAAFDQIRQHARSDVAVTIRLIEALGRVAHFTRSSEQTAAVRAQLDRIHERLNDHVDSPGDRADIQQRYQRALAALERK